MYVGESGAGVLSQTGGTSSQGNIYLGYFSGSAGTYNLGGSAVLSATNEFVGCSGTATFAQTGGFNSVGFLGIGKLGSYQYSGGTLQVIGGGLANQGVFDAVQTAGVLTVAGSAIVNFSQAVPVNTGSMSLNIGPNSLLLLPPGYDPALAFAVYANLGLTHTIGTPLTILPGQGFSGNGSLADFVNCQGTILAVTGGSINLNSGVAVSGTASVFLGAGAVAVNDAQSGISGGWLSATTVYIGNPGTGVFTHTGGTANLGGSYGGLFVGYTAGSTGTYSLGGSGVLFAVNEFLGSSGSGTFTQAGGYNSAGCLNIGSQGRYQFSGGTLQAGSFFNQGTFDATGSTGAMIVAGSSIVNLSQAVLLNTGSMSLSIGPNSLLILPAGFDPVAAFSSYSNQGLVHNVGSPLSVPASQSFSGCGNLSDFINCQGTITSNGWINCNGGLAVSGSGNVNLAGGSFTANDAASGITSGTLQAAVGYVGSLARGRLLSLAE